MMIMTREHADGQNMCCYGSKGGNELLYSDVDESAIFVA